MTGGLRSKTQSSIHSSSGPQTKPGPQAGSRSVQEARAARGVARSVIFFHRRSGPASRNRQRIMCQPGADNLPSSSQSIQQFSGRLCASWDWMSSEEFVERAGCHCRGHDRWWKRIAATCSSFCWVMSAACMRNYGVSSAGFENCKQNIKTQQETLDLTSARAKAGLANELMYRVRGAT